MTSTLLPQPSNAGTTVLRDISYVTHGHERNKLDLYLPDSDTPLPLIIWVHGGAFRVGSKEGGSDIVPALDYLERGYAVASINYRLSQHAIFPAQIVDCKAAVRWGCSAGLWGSCKGGKLRR